MAFCPRCAAPNLENAMACSACGVSLGSMPMPGMGQQQPPPGVPPTPYGSEPYGPYYNMPTTSGMAIGGFVCGILGLLCGLIAIPGLILSILGLQQCRRSNGEVRGAGLAIAGIVISCIFLLLNAIFFMVGFAGGMHRF